MALSVQFFNLSLRNCLMKNRVKGYLFITCAALLYSFIGVFLKFAQMSALSLIFYKLALATFFFFLIFIFARRDVKKLGMDWEMAKFFIPYGFVVALGEVTFNSAYLTTTLANTTFLNGLAPVLSLCSPTFF